jgi:hypothetical protein
MGLAGGSDQDVETNMELAEQDEVKSDQEFAPEASMRQLGRNAERDLALVTLRNSRKSRRCPGVWQRSKMRCFSRKRKSRVYPGRKSWNSSHVFPTTKSRLGTTCFWVRKHGNAAGRGLTIRGKARKVHVELDEKYILGVGNGTRENYIENRFSPSHRQQDDQSASADSLLRNDTRNYLSWYICWQAFDTPPEFHDLTFPRHERKGFGKLRLGRIIFRRTALGIRDGRCHYQKPKAPKLWSISTTASH